MVAGQVSYVSGALALFGVMAFEQRASHDETVLVQLCHEGVKAPCCTEDEGGPFGAARSGGGFKPP